MSAVCPTCEQSGDGKFYENDGHGRMVYDRARSCGDSFHKKVPARPLVRDWKKITEDLVEALQAHDRAGLASLDMVHYAREVAERMLDGATYPEALVGLVDGSDWPPGEVDPE